VAKPYFVDLCMNLLGAIRYRKHAESVRKREKSTDGDVEIEARGSAMRPACQFLSDGMSISRSELVGSYAEVVEKILTRRQNLSWPRVR
jgi:hypothetical protein